MRDELMAAARSFVKAGDTFTTIILIYIAGGLKGVIPSYDMASLTKGAYAEMIEEAGLVLVAGKRVSGALVALVVNPYTEETVLARIPVVYSMRELDAKNIFLGSTRRRLFIEGLGGKRAELVMDDTGWHPGRSLRRVMKEEWMKRLYRDSVEILAARIAEAYGSGDTVRLRYYAKWARILFKVAREAGLKETQVPYMSLAPESLRKVSKPLRLDEALLFAERVLSRSPRLSHYLGILQPRQEKEPA